MTPRSVFRALLHVVFVAAPSLALAQESDAPRPNVLWITIDDCGADFGCYGDARVETPHLDRLAAGGQRFTRCFASTPVCSPVRSGMITGCYATTIGAHQHRSDRALPEGVRPLTELLADAGWRPTFLPHQRVEPEAFARGEASGNTVDRAALELPPYWADDPDVRAAYAGYLEGVQLLDAEVGSILGWLEREGLRERTLVFVVGDHGIAMLRHKQWCYDTGLRVPLIVNGAGVAPAVRAELVSTIDLAAATLRACGVAQPAWMEGRDFLAPDATPRTRVFASRDRCDETEDRVRAVRYGRFKLIHNLRPELPWVGRNACTRRTFPNVELLLARKAAGELTDVQALFMADEKPRWELYDLERDPLELANLAESLEHAETLLGLQLALLEWERETDAANPFPESPDTIVPKKARDEVERLRAASAAQESSPR